jgi:recombination protein RecT
MNKQVAVQQQPNAIVELRADIEKMGAQFQAALPAHIPVERFKRVILTAVQQNPALVYADRQSFWNSAMKAAQDGLLPDSREGAMVIFRTKKKDDNGVDRWIDAVQWMPMVAGIRKKVRNSGEIATWDTHEVYAKDAFEYELGDDPFIKHKPSLEADPGPVIAAYSVAVLKTGEKSREVMTVAQIERVRARSKAKDSGPWVDHYSEMCRKTVAKRHSKVLPMSTDLDDLMRRDDDLYDFKGAREAEKPARPRLADFTNAPRAEAPTQSLADERAAQKPSEEVAEPTPSTIPDKTADLSTDAPAAEFGPADTYDLGREARDAGKPLHGVDRNWTEPMQEAFKQGWRERDKEMEEPA